jgi:hypothetical protein
MDTIQARISLKIDLSNGSLEIDAPEGSFDRAVERARDLLGAMPQGIKPQQTAGAPAATSIAETITQPDAKQIEKAKNRTGRGATASAARPGRLGSFEPVDLGLGETKERELRSFMEAKAPSEQVEQVATAMYKGEQLLDRKGFTYNEIYTLLRLSGSKLPKALDVVLGRMLESQWTIREGQLFSLKFVGRDHVEQNLGKN